MLTLSSHLAQARLPRPVAHALMAGSLLVGTLLAGCGPSIPSSVKIGIAQPLSGPSADRGQDLVNGAKLAVQELNAAGYKIAGKPVTLELVALDDKADPAQAPKIAQQLIDQKVVAVIGHLNSDATAAAVPAYKQAGIPQLFTSSAAELTQLGGGNAFRLVASDRLQAQAVAGYAVTTLKAAKVAIVYEDTAFGKPLNADVSAALAKQGKTVTLSQSTDNKRTDFAEFVAKLKAAPPDVLVAALRDHQLIPLFEQMQSAGLTELPVIATSVAKTRKLATAPLTMKSVYLTSSALTPGEFGTGAAFVKRFEGAYKSEPVWAAHYAYDAVHVIADTLRATDSADPAKLREKLHAIDANAPVTSHMRFNAEGEQAYATVTVYKRRDGQWDPQMRSDKW